MGTGSALAVMHAEIALGGENLRACHVFVQGDSDSDEVRTSSVTAGCSLAKLVNG